MILAIEETAKQWINDELQARSERDPFNNSSGDTKLRLIETRWVLPKLLRIVYQNASQPVQSLAPLIHLMLKEQAFATTGGDPCDCDSLDASINETTAMLLRVLQRVREYSEKQGMAI